MADGKLIFDTGIDSSGFKKGMGALGSVATGAFDIAKKAILGASTAILGFGAYSIKVGADFDAAMSEVQAISGATGADLEALRDKAKEMGATTIFSASESAAALKYMAMAGWESEQMLAGLPGVMNLAAASGEDLAMVSDIVTDSLTAFGMTADEAGHFADVLAAAATSSNTNVSMLGESFKYVAPLAGAMGYSVEDVSVALGLMANAGIKGSQAGTSLRSALTRLAKPIGEAAGLMEEMGLSVTDAEGNMKDLSALLPELRESFADLSEEQKIQAASTLFGKESMAGMLAIINAGDEEFDALTASINDSSGAAEEMAKIMNDNLRGDITILKSALEGLGIAFYEDMDGPLRDVAQKATGYIDQLAEAFGKDGLQGVVEAAGGIVADIAASIAKELPKLVRTGADLIKSLIQGILDDKHRIFGAANTAIKTFIEAAAEIIPQIFVLGIELISALARGFAGNVGDLIPVVVDAIGTVLDTLTQHLPIILAAGIDILLALAEGIRDNLPTIAEAAMEIVTNLVETLIGAAPELIPVAIDIVMALIDTMLDMLPLIIDLGLEIIFALIDGIVDNIPQIIEAIITVITRLLETITEKLPEILVAGIDILMAIIDGLIESIPSLIAAIPQIIWAIVKTLLGHDWIGTGIELLSAIIRGILSMLGAILGAAGQVASGVWQAIKSGWSSAVSWGSELVGKIKQGILNSISSIVQAGTNLARQGWNAIKNLWSSASSIGSDLVRGIWNGISNMTSWIINLIGGFAGSVVSSIKSFFKIGSPSKLLRDEIGRWLPPGIGEGFEDEMPGLERDMLGELGGLGRRLKGAVELQAGELSYALAGGSGTYRSVQENRILSEVIDRKGQLHAVLEVEGRPFAKATAEYTTEEQALSEKRKRA